MTLKEVLRGVIDAVTPVRSRAPRRVAAAVTGTKAGGSTKLTQAAYWRAIQDYLRPGDVLFVDNGTSFVLLGLKLPPNCTFIGSINWGWSCRRMVESSCAVTWNEQGSDRVADRP